MHYSNMAIVPKDGDDDIEEKVTAAMGPDEESGGFHDWWQIGGRWTGLFDGYEPEKDPKNIVKCDLCHGTGKRDDEVGLMARAGNPGYTCNGCDGKGERATWSTQWGVHAGDIVPIETVTEEQYKKFFRVVVEPGREFGGEDYRPWKEIREMFKKREMPPLEWLKKEYAGHLAVVVDNHS